MTRAVAGGLHRAAGRDGTARTAAQITCERWTGAFARSLALPPGIETDPINATFRNGVLEIHLPKSKEAKGKKIAITVEQPTV